MLIFPRSGSSLSMSWNVLNLGLSFSFYEMTSTSLIEPSCTSCFSKLGEHILKSCAVTSKYVSLIFSNSYSHFFLNPVLWGKSPLRWTHGPIKNADIIWPSPRIGLQKLREPRLCSSRWPSSRSISLAEVTPGDQLREL